MQFTAVLTISWPFLNNNHVLNFLKQFSVILLFGFSLPKLPMEFYDHFILNCFAFNICTKDAKRGQYVRLCLQVPIDQLLITLLYVGDYYQSVTYEGIPLLCYNCRRIEHHATLCTHTQPSYASYDNPQTTASLHRHELQPQLRLGKLWEY